MVPSAFPVISQIRCYARTSAMGHLNRMRFNTNSAVFSGDTVTIEIVRKDGSTILCVLDKADYISTFRRPHMSRNDAWIETFTGRKFHVLDPVVSEVCIKDIAHALSLLTRFTGHTRHFYSVADHSLRVSLACDPVFALDGLLHDGSEAYLADISSPLKHSPEMVRYRAAEKRVQSTIAERFGLSPKEPENVKFADRRMLVTEKRDLMNPYGPAWENFKEFAPFPETIIPLSAQAAEKAFLRRFYELRFVQGELSRNRLTQAV